MDLKDVRVDSPGWLISLSKLMNRPIKDVYGYFSKEFGEVSFKLTDIIFEDGVELGVEGEHDFPYVVDNYAKPVIDEELWEELYRQWEAEP